jgi:phage head maturation protease
MDHQFKILTPITKAFTRVDKDGVERKYIGGLASSTDMDLEMERMAESAILAFRKAIQEGIFTSDGRWSQVPLRTGHGHEWNDVLGWLTDATVDAQWNLFIEAELDTTNPVAIGLFEKLTRPQKPGRELSLGLSVGGLVVSAGQEWDETLQDYIGVYYDVALKEVSVTSNPANPKTYVHALAKSVDWTKVNGSRTVLVTEEELEEYLMKTKPETTDAQVEKSEQVVAASVEASEEVEVVERSEAAEEAVAEAQVEKTDATDEAAEAEVVERSESAEAGEGAGEGSAEEVAKDTDPMAELRAQIVELTKAVGDIAAVVAGLNSSTVADAEAETTEKSVESEEQAEADASVDVVERSVEEAEEPAQVEKAESATNLVEIIAAAVSKAVEAQVGPLVQRVEELEAEEVDKSVAVTLEDAENEADPLEKFRSEVSGLKGRDILAKTLEAAGLQR